MPEISTLSRKGKSVFYDLNQITETYEVTWGDTVFEVSNKVVSKILNEFFQNPKAWYPLGASVAPIFNHGLGEFVLNLGLGFTPRHASAIAAIMVNEKMLQFRNGKPILLSKQSIG